jgi:hypothetical protein
MRDGGAAGGPVWRGGGPVTVVRPAREQVTEVARRSPFERCMCATEATEPLLNMEVLGRNHGFAPTCFYVLHEYAPNSSFRTSLAVLHRRGELLAIAWCGVHRAGEDVDAHLPHAVSS